MPCLRKLHVTTQNASSCADTSWERTHLQAIQDFTVAEDFQDRAHVLVAEQHLSLVSVEPAAEGHLCAQLLPGHSAALYCRRHTQRGFAPAQVLQLLVSEAVHPDGACVVSCRNEKARADNCSPLGVFLHTQ